MNISFIHIKSWSNYCYKIVKHFAVSLILKKKRLRGRWKWMVYHHSSLTPHSFLECLTGRGSKPWLLKIAATFVQSLSFSGHGYNTASNTSSFIHRPVSRPVTSHLAISCSNDGDNQSMVIICFFLYLSCVFLDPVLIDTSMTVVNIQWSNCGYCGPVSTLVWMQNLPQDR